MGGVLDGVSDMAGSLGDAATDPKSKAIAEGQLTFTGNGTIFLNDCRLLC